MSTERERCKPQTVGFAADVQRILDGYSSPLSLKRYEVPTEPGVYRGLRDGGSTEIMAQLDGDGQWWPYPFSFSGWRISELTLFELTPVPELKSDVPEIPDPELRATVDDFSQKLLESFPEIADAERAKRFAMDYVLDSD